MFGGSIDSLIAGVVAAVTALGWLFRLEGRITTNERVAVARYEAMKELTAAMSVTWQRQIDETKGTLRRIEDKQDTLTAILAQRNVSNGSTSGQ